MNPLTADTNALAQLVTGLRAGGPLARDPVPVSDPVFMNLRREGRGVWSEWYEGDDFVEALDRAFDWHEPGTADVLEICLTRNYRDVPPDRFRTAFADPFRGRRGIEISSHFGLRRQSPSQTIATNRRFARDLEKYFEAFGVDEKTFRRSRGAIRAFAARQLLVFLDGPVRCVELYRGNRIVEPATVGVPMIRGLVDGMVGWTLANTATDGQLTYEFWPSRSEEPDTDNTIRRFMATVATLRAARLLGRSDLSDAADRNLRYNLERFYVEVDGVGGIAWDGSIKLGAMAMAALAILEHPARGRYEAMREKLSAGVDLLWRRNGAFRTFLRPEERNDNQDSYPGQALLYWAHLHGETGDATLRDQCLKSFRYYRDRHLANRNAAFVPWHSQACAMLYEQTGETDLRDWVFEMNDWLLPMQQWGAPLAPDLWGRFVDPRQPKFGPSHVSATGAFLGGLADALKLAREAGDAPRATLYERAVWRAVRSLRQLQFVDGVDAFYTRQLDRVLGGLRTETYNNRIRVDNVQHGLIALLKLPGALGFTFGDKHS
jgi:hypothetical protein